MSEITWVEVDLNAIKLNLEAIKSKVESGTIGFNKRENGT